MALVLSDDTTSSKFNMNSPFVRSKETLAVGMATFSGSIALRSINDNPPIHPRVKDISLGKMNKNKSILSSLAIELSLTGNDNDNSNNSEVEKTAKLTLYAARLDVLIKQHKIYKTKAIRIIYDCLNNIGCNFACNEKTGSIFTITVYDFGSCQSIDDISNIAAEALSSSGDIDGIVSPDVVKVHLTGCRKEEEINECAKTFLEVFSSYGTNFYSIQTYNVMCNSTYYTGRKLCISNFVKYMSESLKTIEEFPRACIIYDNTRKPNQVLLIIRFDIDTIETEELLNDMKIWRENYEITLTIKDNGKIDQSSFSRKYGMMVQHILAKLLNDMNEDAFRD